MKRSTITRALLTIVGLSFLVLACTSLPPEDVEGLTALEMLQRAQERSDVNDWNGAYHWYQATMNRFSDDIDVVTTCRYEIAFLRYKQGGYKEAAELFQELIADYHGPDGAYMPPRFFTLSQRVLQTIAEK